MIVELPNALIMKPKEDDKNPETNFQNEMWGDLGRDVLHRHYYITPLHF